MATESIQGIAALQKRMKALGETEPVMRWLQLATIAEAQKLVPRKTGNLARSIHPGSVSKTEAQVIASANYAGYVEKGTKPHIIRPKKGKALRWPAKGAAVRLSGRATVATQRAGNFAFATLVHHPGTKPQPFLRLGAVHAVEKSGLKDILIGLWNKAA